MALTRYTLTATVTLPWPAVWTEAIEQAAAVPVTTPAVPASTVAALNDNTFPVTVTVSGGTVTVISVNSSATGLTSGAVGVPAFGTIAITYSVQPTWTWAPLLLQSSGAMQQAQVSAAAVPGGQAGPIPSYTFQRGTVVYADPAAITPGTQGSGPQQLYQAIGAGNLAVFRDGSDAVGHAALAN